MPEGTQGQEAKAPLTRHSSSETHKQGEAPIAMRIEEIRRGLTARLRARRDEIEQATLTRVSSVPDPTENPDPEYTEGVKVAVTAAP